MIVGQKYLSSQIDTHYDAIVIGSGLGGLTTAALMAKAGKKVLVLERHYTAGALPTRSSAGAMSGTWACTTSARCTTPTRPCAGCLT